MIRWCSTFLRGTFPGPSDWRAVFLCASKFNVQHIRGERDAYTRVMCTFSCSFSNNLTAAQQFHDRWDANFVVFVNWPIGGAKRIATNASAAACSSSLDSKTLLLLLLWFIFSESMLVAHICDRVKNYGTAQAKSKSQRHSGRRKRWCVCVCVCRAQCAHSG